MVSRVSTSVITEGVYQVVRVVSIVVLVVYSIVYQVPNSDHYLTYTAVTLMSLYIR